MLSTSKASISNLPCVFYYYMISKIICSYSLSNLLYYLSLLITYQSSSSSYLLYYLSFHVTYQSSYSYLFYYYLSLLLSLKEFLFCPFFSSSIVSSYYLLSFIYCSNCSFRCFLSSEFCLVLILLSLRLLMCFGQTLLKSLLQVV